MLQSLSKDHQYVFLCPRGGRLKPDTVRNILVREVIAKVKDKFPKMYPGERCFKDGRLHNLQHYFCSTCANNWDSGADGHVLARTCRHRDGPSLLPPERRKVTTINGSTQTSRRRGRYKERRRGPSRNGLTNLQTVVRTLVMAHSWHTAVYQRKNTLENTWFSRVFLAKRRTRDSPIEVM